MKRALVLISLAGLVAATLVHAAVQQPSGYDLLQQGLAKERAEGKLDEAIQIYQRILREHSTDRPLAAKALLQLGRCYEKLGRGEARKAYERVVREYGDQADLAAEARGRLEALNPAGGAAPSTTPVARRIWGGPEVDPLGAPSPDGRYLSYVDWMTGDLAVRTIATGESRRLTKKGTWETSTEFALMSVPSADGQQIAYAWFDGKARFDLRVVSAAGGAPRVIYSNQEIEYVQPVGWSPDGKSIAALLAGLDHTMKIAMVAIADGSARVLKTLDWREPGKVSLSPDGRYIAYDFPAGANTHVRDVFVLETNGARETVLVKHPANDSMPVWTPDGRHVMFLSDRAGTTGAWLARVNEGQPAGPPVLIKPDMGRAAPAGFTRNGNFYYHLEIGMNDIYLAELDPTTGALAAAPAALSMRFVGGVNSPSWSPDGSTLAYVSQRGPIPGQRSRTLVLHSIATGEEQELLVPMNLFRYPRWAPDGGSLLLIGNDDKNRPGLYRFDLKTRTVTAIIRAEPLVYIHSAEWLPDGRRVVYSVRSGDLKNVRVVRLNLETGEETELYRGGSPNSEIAVSPDGRQVVLHVGAGAQDPRFVGLKVVPTEGGPARDLVQQAPGENIPPVRVLAWTRDGQHVLFSKGGPPTGPEEQRLELWRIRADGTDPRKTGLAMRGFRDISPHPDGRRIAFTAGQQKFEMWMMENLLPVTTKTTAARR